MQSLPLKKQHFHVHVSSKFNTLGSLNVNLYKRQLSSTVTIYQYFMSVNIQGKLRAKCSAAI